MRGGRYWQWAGKWAARADDVSWLPARLTALLLALVAGVCRCAAWRRKRARRRHPTAAGPWWRWRWRWVCGCPGVYQLHAAGRAPTHRDAERAQKLVSKVALTLVLIALAAIVLWFWNVCLMPHALAIHGGPDAQGVPLRLLHQRQRLRAMPRVLAAVQQADATRYPDRPTRRCAGRWRLPGGTRASLWRRAPAKPFTASRNSPFAGRPAGARAPTWLWRLCAGGAGAGLAVVHDAVAPQACNGVRTRQ